MAEADLAEPDVEGTARLFTRLSVEHEPMRTVEGNLFINQDDEMDDRKINRSIDTNRCQLID